MTFAEIVAAMQARLDHRVEVRLEENGRIRRTYQGVLRPGLDGVTEAVPDEEDRVVFRVAPHAWWFRLDPRLVTDAREQPERRLLRVEMGSSAIVVETRKSAA